MKQLFIILVIALLAFMPVGSSNSQNVKASLAAVSAQNDTKGFTVYITPYGQRYHRLYCGTIKNSKKTAMSIEDAKKRGRTPCKVCHPPNHSGEDDD